MGFMLTSHLRATYDAGAKCVTTDVTVLRDCELVNVLASGRKAPRQPCPPEFFSPRDRDELRASHRLLCLITHFWPPRCLQKGMVIDALQPLFVCVKRYKSLSMGACQLCFSSIDAVNFETCGLDCTSAWSNHPVACSWQRGVTRPT